MIGYRPVEAQDLPGLSYCLLFDSKLEKEAFLSTDDIHCDPLTFLLAYDSKVDSLKYKAVRNELYGYSEKLLRKKKRSDGELEFLKYVFKNVHQKYLKDYRVDETFTGVFNTGRYNCISGTALYACILDLLGYKSVIYETRYHIFLLVKTDSAKILFEATDPVRGFVAGNKAVSSRVTGYLKNERQQLTDGGTLSAPFNANDILEAVNLKELAGLHYYNIGMHLINQQNYYDAFRALKKASILYPRSERIKDFLQYTSSKYDWQLSSVFDK